MPTTYKTLRTTFTYHLAFPTSAEATKAITSTKPITNSNTQKAHFWPAIRFSLWEEQKSFFDLTISHLQLV